MLQIAVMRRILRAFRAVGFRILCRMTRQVARIDGTATATENNLVLTPRFNVLLAILISKNMAVAVLTGLWRQFAKRVLQICHNLYLGTHAPPCFSWNSGKKIFSPNTHGKPFGPRGSQFSWPLPSLASSPLSAPQWNESLFQIPRHIERLRYPSV
jgi:hypothetical protein